MEGRTHLVLKDERLLVSRRGFSPADLLRFSDTLSFFLRWLTRISLAETSTKQMKTMMNCIPPQIGTEMAYDVVKLKRQ